MRNSGQGLRSRPPDLGLHGTARRDAAAADALCVVRSRLVTPAPLTLLQRGSQSGRRAWKDRSNNSHLVSSMLPISRPRGFRGRLSGVSHGGQLGS